MVLSKGDIMLSYGIIFEVTIDSLSCASSFKCPCAVDS